MLSRGRGGEVEREREREIVCETVRLKEAVNWRLRETVRDCGRE